MHNCIITKKLNLNYNLHVFKGFLGYSLKFCILFLVVKSVRTFLASRHSFEEPPHLSGSTKFYRCSSLYVWIHLCVY